MAKVRINQLGEHDGKLKFRFTWFEKRKSDGKRRQRRKTLSFISTQCAVEWANMKEIALSGKWDQEPEGKPLVQVLFA